MHILDIPIEISNEIFYHSNKEDLLQCALACKSWEMPALQSLYGDLTLDAYSVYLLKSKLKWDADKRDGYFKYGSFVKSLVIHYDDKINLEDALPDVTDIDCIPDEDCEFNGEDLIRLLEYLPNIQVLDFHESVHVAKYYQFIIDSESTSCLNHIRSIPYKDSSFEKFHTSDIYDVNFLICYKYRATITNLVVHYKHPMIDVDSQHDRTLTFVSHFTNLVDLTLENTFDHQLTLFDIQKACPHLISLGYNSNCRIPDIILEDNFNNPANRDLTRHLKTLKLDVPSVSVSLVNYLTDYVPAQVDTLHIIMNDTDICDWIDSIGINNALKLAARLNAADHTSLDFTPDRRYSRKSVLVESKMTLLFKLVGAIKGNKKTFCHSQYKEFSSVQDIVSYDVEQGVNFRYSLDRADFSMDGGNIALPDIKYSIAGPEIINYMQIALREVDPDMPSRFLNYTLNHCPNLLLFEFRFTYNLYHGIRITTDMNPKKTSGHSLTKSTAENLKVIKIGDIIPSVELLNLISTRLPNIEFMSCGSPSKNRKGSKTAEIDLRAFKNLKKFCFNLELMLERHSKRSATILLQYSDGSEKCYSQVKGIHSFVELPLDNFNDIKNTEVPGNCFVIIKCNKNTRLYAFFDGTSLAAEFGDEEFIDHTEDSTMFEENCFFL